MADAIDFSGFPKGCVKFFRDLAAHNTKAWYEGHKEEYERFVKTPAVQFVVAVGDRLRAIAPDIHAEPAINKSIFKINRDVRFSADKSPYKAYLGIWLWEGQGPRMECSGFYLHVEPPRIQLGAGIYMFSKTALDQFRRAVVDAQRGPELTRVAAALEKAGYPLGGSYYKKAPAGYDPQHANARFLLYNGLYATDESPIPQEFYSRKFIDYCVRRYNVMAPLHSWLKGIIK